MCFPFEFWNEIKLKRLELLARSWKITMETLMKMTNRNRRNDSPFPKQQWRRLYGRLVNTGNRSSSSFDTPVASSVKT